MLLFSCKKEDINSNPTYKIGVPLKKYVDSFYLEAKLQGFEIPKKYLIVKTKEITTFSEECVVCQINTKKPEQQKTVTISIANNLCYGSKPKNAKGSISLSWIRALFTQSDRS